MSNAVIHANVRVASPAFRMMVGYVEVDGFWRRWLAPTPHMWRRFTEPLMRKWKSAPEPRRPDWR